MSDHRTMEFLTCAHRPSKLEELDRIRAVCDRLIALGAHLPRLLQGIISLPVLLTRRLLHQHERLILKPPHQIVAQRRHTPRRIIARIVIPGYNIHLLRPFEIIQSLKRPHQIRGDRGILVILPYSVPFHLEVIQNTV